MTEFEKNCYGMSTYDIRTEYMNGLTARLSGLEMVVMGILSDCQEMLGDKEFVRKQLNVAKYILGEMMDAQDAQYEEVLVNSDGQEIPEVQRTQCGMQSCGAEFWQIKGQASSCPACGCH